MLYILEYEVCILNLFRKDCPGKRCNRVNRYILINEYMVVGPEYLRWLKKLSETAHKQILGIQRKSQP